MRVLVTGAGGLVGGALTEHSRAAGDEVFNYDRQALDITNRELVKSTMLAVKPQAVINCAAFTDVDRCEFDPERAQAANAVGPENLADASRLVNATFVTISTDYVFDGRKEGFYTQDDDPNPISVYGRSKLDGERRAQLAYPRTIVVRSGFIFGPGGRNFLSTIVDRARRGETLKAIGDAYGTPTFARHLAARLRELAQLDVPGVFHVVNEGAGVSYEEFARKALDRAGFGSGELQGIEMDSLNRPAPRPRNSRLKCLVSGTVGLSPLPSWEQAVEEFVEASAQPGTAQRA
ncbi:MAG TPA: dTDP-4-dehydrorhamnose reductase [Pyrinomonadaceae bacterium]|nr:dTDP-4-dehydrorhamnose reductase [Pyrinomonadaceae bacterium]